MSRVDWGPLASELRSASRIVLGTHINADGDGIGCEVALHQFLTDIGRRVAVVNNEPVPEKYRFLGGTEAIQVYDPSRHSDLIRGADLFIVLDNSSVERLEKLRGDVEATRALRVCVDHHAAVNPWWTLNCVDTDACASGQLVYELIRHMEGRVTPSIARALYVSFVTDTGHFRFSKTTAEAHRIVADLIEIGDISPARIFTEIYEKTSVAMATLTGLALRSLKLDHGARFAWMQLSREDVAACRGEEEDTGDLANLALSIGGVVAGALFREMPDGKTKVSLRSKGDIDVNSLATAHGGGGHRNASGILMAAPLDSAIREVVGRMEAILPPGAAAPVKERP